ncbi:MAG: propanediol utilization protein, partial [Oscillospiraceae bacterium]|nr:propanediol utilization protein [Oscillospiraceae bacterium]
MSNEKIVIEGSGKHCHVTRATLDTLFGKGFELEVKKYLSQPGQFATPHKITVTGPKGKTELSIIGPCRKADQIELSFTDARSLGF